MAYQDKKIPWYNRISPVIAMASSPEYRDALAKGVTGEKPGEFGDIARRKGVPQPLSAMYGLALDTVATGMMFPSQAKQLTKIPGEIVTRNLENKLEPTINKAISKAIRPSVSGKLSSSQVSNYYNKARQSIQTIYENKDNLKFLDEAGNPVLKLPESLSEFSYAIDQTKNSLWGKIDDLAKQTGEKGLRVNPDNLIKELNSISSNRIMKQLHPEIVDYASQQAKAYWELRSLTPLEAQTEIKSLNNSLKAFYRNPTFETAKKAEIDSLIANNLRKSLDDTVEKATGKAYQPLRNQYAALKSIEQDVSRRVIVDARKNIKGLIDFSDILSGGDMVQGLLKLDPALFATGIAKRGIVNYIKALNDPNRIIKAMFRVVDKANRRGITVK
jgi:hypothetical protein